MRNSVHDNLKRDRQPGWDLPRLIKAIEANGKNPSDFIIIQWSSKWGLIPCEALRLAYYVILDGYLIKDRHLVQLSENKN